MCITQMSGCSFVTRYHGAAMACLSLALILAVDTVARAQVFIEQKLTSSDAAAGDLFGYSVAISGNTAIVGAVADNNRWGLGAGSAYLFDAITGKELFKLTADDGAELEQFGHSVAISGRTAIVGALHNNNYGSAYLFDTTSGGQLFKLTPFNAPGPSRFGHSVAISGNAAIVGALNSGDDDAGSVHLFDVTTGRERFQIDGSGETQFGYSVGLSGNMVIVGAPRDEIGPISEAKTGAAYLFDATTGNRVSRLTAHDAASRDSFGVSVAISDGIAIVGASGNDDSGEESGSAYLFDVNTGVELFKLTASDGAAFDWFGRFVGISGNTAIVGAPANTACRNLIGCKSGTTYLFDVTTGEELAKLTASDASDDDFFGLGVAVSGTTFIVGAPGNDDAGGKSGSAYLIHDIPEPSSFLLAVLALIGLFGFARRRVAIP